MLHCKESTEAAMALRNGDFVGFDRFVGKEWSRGLPKGLSRRLGTWELLRVAGKRGSGVGED